MRHGISIEACRSFVFGCIDADVVDKHGLRISRGGIRWAGPVTANGYVEEQEEGVVEDPGAGGFGGADGGGRAGNDDRRLGCERGVLRGVDVKADFGGFPLDRVNVERVGEMLATGELGGRVRSVAVPLEKRAVDGAVDGGGLFADVLHDVDLAALWPSGGGDVIAEHPEGGPDALACGDLMRASNRPKAWEKRPSVFRRAEVYSRSM